MMDMFRVSCFQSVFFDTSQRSVSFRISSFAFVLFLFFFRLLSEHFSTRVLLLLMSVCAVFLRKCCKGTLERTFSVGSLLFLVLPIAFLCNGWKLCWIFCYHFNGILPTVVMLMCWLPTLMLLFKPLLDPKTLLVPCIFL